MDELAANVAATLRKPSATLDAKLTLLNSLKSNIKHQRLPEAAQLQTVECIKLAIASQTASSLVASGFSALGHLIKRLSLQDQTGILFSPRVELLGVLLERLGDAKESHRSAASQAFSELWLAKPADVEKSIKEGAIMAGNARAKEAGMQWVARMHTQQQLQFRGFVSPIVASLEDADGVIRETAKTTIIDLFKDAKDAAKLDLKKQLAANNVRKSIASHILSQLQISGAIESSTTNPSRPATRTEKPHPSHDASQDSAREAAPPLSQEVSQIEPLHVYSQRELEEYFQQMRPCFEDKEKEENWRARDNNTLKLRRLAAGNAPTDHHTTFVAGIVGLRDGILKVVNSLRTTMSTNGCQLVQELARVLGASLDPIVEFFLSGLHKMCSSTKHISSQNADATVAAILSNASYNIRLMQYIWQACQDKNVSPRAYATGWLKIILKREAHHKAHFESTGGLELADKCIRKGISDPNPGVRESMRGTYWMFARLWPARAEAIMATLDSKSQQLLEKDAGNPNAPPSGTSFTASVGPSAASNPRVAAANARVSLKETIAAQKKASLAAKKMPDRPNSAMSTFSPIKEAPASSRRPPISQSATRGPPGASHSASRAAPVSSVKPSTSQGSLMSGPVRRPRRPDVPRPATADPYANRKGSRPETPAETPVGSPTVGNRSSKAVMPSGHAKAKSTSTAIPQPTESRGSSRQASPNVTPLKGKQSKQQVINHLDGSPFRGSNIGSPPSSRGGLVAADKAGNMPQSSGVEAGSKPNKQIERTEIESSPLAGAKAEDEFTLIMPVNLPSRQPSTETPVVAEQHRSVNEAEQMTSMNGQQAETTGPASMSHSARDAKNGHYEDRTGTPVAIFEDPTEDTDAPSAPADKQSAALDELPINEQQQQPPRAEAAQTSENGIAGIPTGPVKATEPSGSSVPDKAEIMKTRRLLASAVTRISQHRIDAHGLRRVQEVAKSSSPSAELQFPDLLSALLEYLVQPEDGPDASKATTLKAQAIGAIRAIAVLHRKDEDIDRMFGLTLGSLIGARQACSQSPQLVSDLERTIDEIVQHATAEQAAQGIDMVLELASPSPEPRPAPSTVMALGVVSKLLAHLRRQGRALPAVVRERCGRLAVELLGNADPDVRRADTDFCVELHGTYGEGEKGRFWKAIGGAGEAHLNLVAYYIARRQKSS